MKNYLELFHERFGKSTEIDLTFSDLSKSKNKDKVIDYLKGVGATRVDPYSFNIISTIAEFTKNTKSDEEKLRLVKELLVLKNYVNNADIKVNPKIRVPEVVVETNKGVIRAMKFSDIASGIKERFPFIETDKRYRQCFGWASYICLNLGIPNKLVTGYVYGLTDKSNYLHSWIETTLHGEEYVIDGTLNAVINKEGYYLIRNAQVITEIDSDTFSNDIDNYSDVLGQEIPIEVYYVFRDEIIKELEKNKEIFIRK